MIEVQSTTALRSNLKTSSSVKAPVVTVNKLKEQLTNTSLSSSSEHKEIDIPPSDDPQRQQRRGVRFSDIYIREYAITLGDNPSCTSGPPVSLDWQFSEFNPIELDQYEEHRGKRRTRCQLMMNYYHRKSLLMHVGGISEGAIKQAEKQVHRTKMKRNVTKFFLPAQKVEQKMEIVKRRVKQLSK